jgi:hypothetical protein
MKKNFLRTLAVAAIAMFVGYNVYRSESKIEGMSELALENLEALAREEWGNGTCYWEQLYTRCTPTGKTQIGCPCGALGYND